MASFVLPASPAQPSRIYLKDSAIRSTAIDRVIAERRPGYKLHGCKWRSGRGRGGTPDNLLVPVPRRLLITGQQKKRAPGEKIKY